MCVAWEQYGWAHTLQFAVFDRGSQRRTEFITLIRRGTLISESFRISRGMNGLNSVLHSASCAQYGWQYRVGVAAVRAAGGCETRRIPVQFNRSSIALLPPPMPPSSCGAVEELAIPVGKLATPERPLALYSSAQWIRTSGKRSSNRETPAADTSVRRTSMN